MDMEVSLLKESIMDLLTNRVLMCAVVAWIVAQVLKIFTSAAYRKSLKPGALLIRSGGMPSSHSSVVCAACFSCGILYGYDSAIFALSGVLAMVVMRDAAGIRHQVGKQAEILNEMTAQLHEKDKSVKHVTLSELLGHTPLQVFFGALLGIVIAFLCQYWVFPEIFPVTLIS